MGHHIRWGGDVVLTEAIDAPLHFLGKERRDPLDIAGYRRCYAPASVSYDNGRARYTTSGDTLRLYLPDGREILRRSFEELLHDRAAQLRLPLDDEALYTTDNLLVYRTDSLLVSFRRAEASRPEQRYIDVDVDSFFTK